MSTKKLQHELTQPLIDLGYEEPKLRPYLRRILGSINKQAASINDIHMSGDKIFGLSPDTGRLLDKALASYSLDPYVAHSRIRSGCKAEVFIAAKVDYPMSPRDQANLKHHLESVLSFMGSDLKVDVLYIELKGTVQITVTQKL